MNEPAIERLTAELFNTIERFTKRQPMSTGDVMSALFSIMVASAKASPTYNREAAIAQFKEAIAEAFEND